MLEVRDIALLQAAEDAGYADRALLALAEGQSVADALLVGGLLDCNRKDSLASPGEAAGKLDETVERRAREETASLEATLDEIAHWAPRVLYFGSVIFLSVQFLLW